MKKEEEVESELEPIKSIIKMIITSMNTITYSLTTPIIIDNISQIQIFNSDDKKIEIESLSMLNILSNKGIITIKEYIDLTKSYNVTIENFGSKTAMPREVFDSSYFVNNFTYNGNDLGATVYNDGTLFKVWAPTAKSVLLNLFISGDGCDPLKTVKMQKEKYGVWSHKAEGVGHGMYYTYSVETSCGIQEAVDPYAKSAGLNGLRGMVVDHNQLCPPGFENESYFKLDCYRKSIIWETHVRDFSNRIEESRYKGKYLSFTETGMTNRHGVSIGVDHIKELGATHVHLMPVFDFKSVDERKDDQFNWGYDPQNYNVPEGSYSTDARDGNLRVIEFKKMVMSLHQNNLGVVMDVVYNHTYETNSNLNKIVPFYYYRFNDDGTNSNGSGCGNDTCSERVMFRKYIIDSVKYWMETYKIDGFRFDLMGLIDLQTMKEVEHVIHTINPSAIIYGEGWTMGTATSVKLATQPNIRKIKRTKGAAGSVAVFNDAIRDGIRGSVFEHEKPGYLGDPSDEKSVLKVVFGMKGGIEKNEFVSWKVDDSDEVVNYISVHDNNTLFDKLKLSCPDSTEDTIVAMNKMGAALVMLSNGTPLLQSGEEILRTKVNPDGSFNDNSYNSSDEVNNIKWETLTKECIQYQTFLYYKGLIEMRKKTAVLTSPDEIVNVEIDGDCLIFSFEDGFNEKVVAVVNPSDDDYNYELPKGQWSLIVDGKRAGTNEIKCVNEKITVEPKSVNVYREKREK